MNIKEKYNQIDLAKRQKLGEVVRFAIVGGIATVLQYVIYLAAMPLLANLIPALGNSDHTLATVANTLAYILSFIFNFIASTRYTFKVKANAKRGTGFTFSHIVNYSMQTLFLNLFVGLGLAKQMAMIPTLCICIPVNFLLVRFFLKK
nr:GtrA family protein [Prevotella sp.]